MCLLFIYKENTISNEIYMATKKRTIKREILGTRKNLKVRNGKNNNNIEGPKSKKKVPYIKTKDPLFDSEDLIFGANGEPIRMESPALKVAVNKSEEAHAIPFGASSEASAKIDTDPDKIEEKFPIADQVALLNKKLFNQIQSTDTENILPYNAIPVNYPGNDTGHGLTNEQKNDMNGLYNFSGPTFDKCLVASGTTLYNSIVLYKGNLFVNGKCYGTYTGYLENKSEIVDLAIRMKRVEERLENIENILSGSSIYRSDLLGSNQNLTYVWNGDTSDYDNILLNYSQSNKDVPGTVSYRVDRTAFILNRTT